MNNSPRPPDPAPVPGPGGTPSGPVAGSSWPAVGALLLVIAAIVAYFVLPLHELGPQRPVLSWTLLCVSLGLIALLILRQILDVLQDRPEVSSGLLLPLLLCLSVLVFAGAYYVLGRVAGEISGLSTRLDALYFTLVTLATIGYGDIVPQGQSARGVVIVQIVYTFVFVTAAGAALSRRVRRAFEIRHHVRDRPPS
ncbi:MULTISPECIES: potassium channel family protein [unclassified Streptomyces]|uniref:potassium channel family protein n=1 Tax=unclassified Streptomyces TaxID=2593676 RepID=UPI0033A767D6